jgi:hypothetical protein
LLLFILIASISLDSIDSIAFSSSIMMLIIYIRLRGPPRAPLSA